MSSRGRARNNNARGRGRGGRARGRDRPRNPGARVVEAAAQAVQDALGAVDAAREAAVGPLPPAPPPQAPDVVIDIPEEEEDVNTLAGLHLNKVIRFEPVCVVVRPRVWAMRPTVVLSLLVSLIIMWTTPGFLGYAWAVLAVSFALTAERTAAGLWLWTGMHQRIFPDPDLPLTVDAAIAELELRPTKWLTYNIIRRVLMHVDLYLQRAAVDCNLACYVETGRIAHIASSVEPLSKHDRRLTHQRACRLQPDQVDYEISSIDSFVDNTRTIIAWAPEQVSQVLTKFYRLPPEERVVQRFEHASRVTNIMISGNRYFDVTRGSSIVAVLKANNRDISDIHSLRTANLNGEGACDLRRMVSGTAFQILWICLLSALILLTFRTLLPSMKSASGSVYSVVSARA